MRQTLFFKKRKKVRKVEIAVAQPSLVGCGFQRATSWVGGGHDLPPIHHGVARSHAPTP